MILGRRQHLCLRALASKGPWPGWRLGKLPPARVRDLCEALVAKGLAEAEPPLFPEQGCSTIYSINARGRAELRKRRKKSEVKP